MIRYIKILLLLIMLGTLSAGLFQVYKWANRPKNSNPQTQKREEINLTFIEGLRLEDMALVLEKNKIQRPETFLKNLAKKKPAQIFPELNIPDNIFGLEGFLFPDTYRIYKPEPDFSNDSEKELLDKMLRNFKNKFTVDIQNGLKAQGLSNYEGIVLASIIEKETGRNAATLEQKAKLDEERGVVAGIFYNRLKIKMALQSDATINYITGKNDPAASLEDIKINSAYNTYKYPGLPPGPICSPSFSSLMAAAFPTKNNYLYFLHKQPSGEPVYSKTFEEHVQNKYKYLK